MTLPPEALPLAAGTILALIALTVVLGPLVSDADATPQTPPAPKPVKSATAEGTAVAALREIEFDRATGKLSDDDYEAMRASYTRDALAELRAADNLATRAAVATGGPVTDDLVEAAIRRASELKLDCIVCGPRPEPDAIFCSSCGRYLAGACGNCGTPVELVGARFCVGCGEGLVAA